MGRPRVLWETVCVYVFVLEKSFVFGKGEEEGSKQNNVIEKEFCKELPVIPIGKTARMMSGAVLMPWWPIAWHDTEAPLGGY